MNQIQIDKNISNKYSSEKNKKPEVVASGLSTNNTLSSDNHSVFVPNISNKGKDMHSGFFKVPRSLFKDPFWITVSAKYKMFFITLLELVCYAPQKFNDNGQIISLEIGQVCITERELVNVLGKGYNKTFVRRALDFFRRSQKTDHKVDHRKTIITIIDPEICELMKNKSGPRNGPKTDQERTIKEEYKKTKKETHVSPTTSQSIEPKSDNICSVSSLSFGLACFLFESIKSINPKAKEPNLKEWARHVELMIRRDNRTAEEIKQVIVWVSKHDFWKTNILSTKKLRDQFDQLWTQMIHRKEGKQITNIADVQKNKEYAEQIGKKYISTSQKSIVVTYKAIEFVASGNTSHAEIISFDDNNFVQKVNNCLVKRDYVKTG